MSFDGESRLQDDAAAGAIEGDPSAGLAQCEDRLLPGQPLRRLSSAQYANTIRDLFGEQLARPLLQDTVFPATRIDRGFVNDAEANVVNTAESNAIEDNAERVAGVILADPDAYVTGLLPCELSSGYADADVDGCMDDFIAEFGTRAYRRPLTEGETQILRGLYDQLREDNTAVESLSSVVQLLVQAPALLYRVERGADEALPGLVRLGDYEMASRLSYFFLDSMPDDALFAEAAGGRLSTPAEVEQQARRLMESSHFASVLDNHHRDWLHLHELDRMTKDPQLHPDFNDEVRAALMQEASRFVRHVIEEGDGSVRSLLSSSTVPLNSVLADYYGVSAQGADIDSWVPTEVESRRGLFTLASFQGSQAGVDRTDPIHRGLFYQEEVLCNDLPPFPGNVDTQSVLRDTSMLPTARQRLSPLMDNAPCNGCHTLFNPTGLAFENFDAAGQWRDQEGGTEIDSSGTVELDGEQHAFDGPLEMAALVADSAQARDCYSLQWFRDALGRHEFAEDACSIALVEQVAADTDGSIEALLIAITQTDAFLYRAVTEVEP